jgi:tetratricopeptide (TPR) repeat protein
MGKHKKKSKKNRNGGLSTTSNVPTASLPASHPLSTAAPMGAFWRAYPPRELRLTFIEHIKSMPEAERSGDDWWQLGEYQVLEGLSASDESVINAGSQALMAGANLSPPHAGCLLDLGFLLCFKGLDQMALFYLDKAAQQTPTSRDVWSLRGVACIRAGNREEAIRSFQTAVTLVGSPQSDRKNLQDLEAGVSLEQLREDNVLQKFDIDPSRGNDEDPKEAARNGIILLSQELARKPDDLKAAYGLAYSHYVLGQLEHAEPLLLRVIGEDDEHADALTLLGLISMKRSRPDAQKTYYERAVRADPHHVLANTNLASLYHDQGEFHRARPLLLRAIQAAAPDDQYLPIALDLLGNSYGLIEGDFEREAELHRQAIALQPRRAVFHRNLVITLLSLGRVKDAHQTLQAAKNARLILPEQDMVEKLVRVYRDGTLHPYEYMQLVDKLGPNMGWAAMKPLVKRAWERRNHVALQERIEFLGGLAMMASKTGDHELALQIWRHGRSLPGGEPFGPNLAVELTNLGRHAEALAAAASMSMDTPRSWTILGNTRRSAGQYKLAIEAYRIALEKDERFLLPISNAVDTARDGLLAEELDPFIERLRSGWQASVPAMCVLGRALVLQGKLSSATECFLKALWDGNEVRSPEQIWGDGRDENDLSLMGEPDASEHYSAAVCFLELGRVDLVMALVGAVKNWPQWMNGDWTILEAEVYLSASQPELATSIITQMKRQPPPMVVAAKIAMSERNYEVADQVISEGLADEDAENFNFPYGRPDAMFRSLAARRALEEGDSEKSELLARDAIRRDPSCPDARISLANALAGRASEEERRAVLVDGLRRSPGHPALVEDLVESLVSGGDWQTANSTFQKYRPLLEERGAKIVAYRLAEFLAIDRLSQLEAKNESTPSLVQPWPWLEKLPQPLRNWMRAAHLAIDRSEELAAAYGLYTSKVAEYLLVAHIMTPFRDSMSDAQSLGSERHRDVAKFMNGDMAPSIGSIARLLESASGPYRSSEEELTSRFRKAVISGKFGDARTLRSSEFIGQLKELGKVRNSTAHLGDLDLATIRAATRCVVDQGEPGIIFSALGMS